MGYTTASLFKLFGVLNSFGITSRVIGSVKIDLFVFNIFIYICQSLHFNTKLSRLFLQIFNLVNMLI